MVGKPRLTTDRGLSVSEAWARVTPRPGGARVHVADEKLADALTRRGLRADCHETVSLVGLRPTRDDRTWCELFEEDEPRALLDAVLDPDPEWLEPGLKPTIVVKDLPLVVEVDNTVGRGPKWADVPNRHHLPEGVEDDYARDVLYEAVGRPVLRIRRPGAPTLGTWPWRIVTTSQSPWDLADKIVAALGWSKTRENPMDLTDYEWRLLDVMAARGMPKPMDLAAAMRERGYHYNLVDHVDRLCHDEVDRVNIRELLTLMDILECTFEDLVVRVGPGMKPPPLRSRLRVVKPEDWA